MCGTRTPAKRRTRSRLAAFAALSGLIAVTASTTGMATEELPYRVLEHDGAFELRQYPPYLVAETRIRADFDSAGNQGFRRLLRYLSGANRASASIAMTAPVSQVAEGDEYRVAFVMPAGYTLATLPVPLDPAVTTRQAPAELQAVWRYSGRWTESRFNEMEDKLRHVLPSHGLAAIGTAIIARYDAPFIPWPLRRNEVLIPVKKAP